MAGFIKLPNLPEGTVKAALIGENNSITADFLQRIGVECYFLKKNVLLDDETRNHADMLCSYCGNGRFILSQNDEISDVLTNKYKADINIEKGIKAPYPHDIALNACFIDKYLLCRENALSQYLKDFCINNDIKIIDTKQGYSKCSVCVVNANSVITEDEGIAYLLKKYQYDVLLIKRGAVYLSDKHCGFIGGCSGLISKNTMYFNGDIKKHPQYDDIADFLKSRKIDIVYNEKINLTDFGGFIPFYEK